MKKTCHLKKKETRKPKQNSGIKQNTKLFGEFYEE